MCSGPVSPPTNSRLRPISARSSARSNSPKSSTRAPRVAASSARGGRDAIGGGAIRRPRAEHDPPLGDSRRPARQRLDERRLRPAPERIAGADVHHDQLVLAGRRRAAAAVRDPRDRRPDRAASRRRPVPGRRVRRSSRRSRSAGPTGSPPNAAAAARARADGARVHPAGAPDVVADALRRAGGPGQPRAARPAVQVNHHVEPPARSRHARRTSSRIRARPARPLDTITSSRWGLPRPRRRVAFDEIAHTRASGNVRAQRPDHRRREHDVADQSQADEAARARVTVRWSPRRAASPGCRP